MQILINKKNNFCLGISNLEKDYEDDNVRAIDCSDKITQFTKRENNSIIYLYKFLNNNLILSDYTLTDEYKADKLKQIKQQRNAKLAATDWIMLSDSQPTMECLTAFEVYRQQLRDLPNQEGFDVNNVIWPVEPTYVKE